MFSIIELIISFILALLFVLMFKVQKTVMPFNYFASSQLILGTSVTVKMVLMRIIIIFVFGTMSFLIIRDSSVVLLGVFLGSVLIVWPVVLNPSELYYWGLKKFEYILLIASNIFFVVSSFSIVYVSILLFPYVSEFTIDKLKDLPGDLIIPLILSIFGFPGKQVIDKYLEKRVSARSEETIIDSDSYDYEDAEHAATQDE